MKLHIGVASQTGLAHSAVVTSANVHGRHPLSDLLHGNGQRVYGDSAYASQKDLIHSAAPNARDFTNQRIRRNGVVKLTPFRGHLIVLTEGVRNTYTQAAIPGAIS